MAIDGAGTVFDVRFYNIIVLGISFMLIFTAFQTASMAEKSVLDSAKKDTTISFSGDGYISLSIIYWVFAVSNWAAPSVVSFIGPKFSMVAGSLLYFLFILSFLKPMNWALYTSSVLVGFGAAILWTGQGNFLTINSDSESISRNSGIFWALLQTSLIFGNIYSHFELAQNDTITATERTRLFIGLSGAALLGTLSLFALRKKRAVDSEDLVNLNARKGFPSDDDKGDDFTQFYNSLYRFLRKYESCKIETWYTHGQWADVSCIPELGPRTYNSWSFELTFFSGVYGTCISNNPWYGSEAKGLIGISGIFIGIGEILGGALFGLLGKKTNRYGRDIIVVFGYVVHMVCFYLIFINFPERSPIEPLPVDNPKSTTYISSNKYLAIFSSFLLGLGDSSFNTQLYSLIGFMFPEDSSPAFALFKFVQSVMTAIGFYYSTVLVLQWQLLLMVVVGTIGTFCFCIVEWKATKAHREGYRSI